MKIALKTKATVCDSGFFTNIILGLVRFFALAYDLMKNIMRICDHSF